MKHDKSYLRNKFILRRKNKHLSPEKFNFNLIFKIIKKHFNDNKIFIAGYYPSNYEVNVLSFLEQAANRNFKLSLPVVTSSISMSFRPWVVNEPLYVSKFGILEPDNINKKIIPDLVLVPLVAFDSNLNRIGYGKGYYDKNLEKIKKNKKKTITIGVAYFFQKYKGIPINKHDFKLDYIFTERGIISSKK